MSEEEPCSYCGGTWCPRGEDAHGDLDCEKTAHERTKAKLVRLVQESHKVIKMLRQAGVSIAEACSIMTDEGVCDEDGIEEERGLAKEIYREADALSQMLEEL